MPQTKVQTSWKQARLGDYISIKHGFAFKGEYFTEEENENVLLSPGNFNIGGGFKADKFKYYNGEIPEDYVLKSDDLMVTMTDLSKAGDTLGYPAKIPHSNVQKYLHNQRLGLVKFKSNDIDKSFLYYLMCTRNYQQSIVNSATGSTVRHTSPTRIESYEFLLPPLLEQRAIAAILTALDYKIDLLGRQNETLEALAQGLFKEWFVDFNFLNEQGRPYKKSGGKMVDSKAGNIPTGWTAKPLFEIADYINGSAFKDSDFSKNGQGLPVIRIAELKNGLTSQTNYTGKELASKYYLHDNDILFSWSGSPETSIDIFIWNKGNAVLNQHIFKVVAKDEELKTWIFFLLKHHKPFFVHRAKQKQTTGLGHVTVSDLKNHYIPFPSKDISKKYNIVAKPIFQKIILNLNQLQTLTNLRDMLLPRLMRGETRIKNI